MNRRERRRAAKLGDIGQIRLGRVVFDIKPSHDVSRDICYVCGKPATAWPHSHLGMAHGVAEIEASSAAGQGVLLCEVCFDTPHIDRSVIRKFLRLPGLQFEEGGEISTDELRSPTLSKSEAINQQTESLVVEFQG